MVGERHGECQMGGIELVLALGLLVGKAVDELRGTTEAEFEYEGEFDDAPPYAADVEL